MSIDKVTTRNATSYLPARRKANTKFTVDGVTPVDKPPTAADEESRGHRNDAEPGAETPTREAQAKQKGRIDERI